MIGPAFLAVLACLGAAYGQGPQFEVASVKPSPPPLPGRFVQTVVRGGPGSSDPGRATFENVDLFSLIAMAYDIQRYQLSGPEWLSAARFDIAAKIPQGATRDQYRLMLQNLLAERFKLAVHHETKEIRVYELVVAKNGPKLKESTVDPAAADNGPQPPPLGSSLPPGYNGPRAMQFTKVSMERFVANLGGQLGQPVTDGTGLKGNYDIKLRWTGLQAPAASEPADIGGADSLPSIFSALQEQLGLKLEPRKAPIEYIVVDKAEKVPTEN